LRARGDALAVRCRLAQAAGDTIGKIGNTIVASMPPVTTIIPKSLSEGSDVITGVAGGIRSPRPARRRCRRERRAAPPLDADVAAIFADRKAKVALYKATGCAACARAAIGVRPSNAAHGRTSSCPTPKLAMPGRCVAGPRQSPGSAQRAAQGEAIRSR
jgi:hypothetical protein